MPRRIAIASVDDIPPGEGRAVEADDRIVAVFNVDGQFYAIDDACPHMGASLAEGHLEGCVVTCPLHAWRFDIRDGSWCDNPRVKTDSWPISVEGNEVYITLPDDE